MTETLISQRSFKMFTSFSMLAIDSRSNVEVSIVVSATPDKPVDKGLPLEGGGLSCRLLNGSSARAYSIAQVA